MPAPFSSRCVVDFTSLFHYGWDSFQLVRFQDGRRLSPFLDIGSVCTEGSYSTAVLVAPPASILLLPLGECLQRYMTVLKGIAGTRQGLFEPRDEDACYAPSKGLAAVWYAVGPPFFIRHGVFFFDAG